MSRFSEVFGPRPILLPVIHVDGPDPITSTKRNIEAVIKAGCKGAWLISHHSLDCRLLLAFVHELVMVYHHELPWIGVNALDANTEDLFGIVTEDVAGVWSDYSGITRQGCSDDSHAIRNAQIKSGWTGLYFAGVDFKHQAVIPIECFPIAAQAAKKAMDVVVMSGDATGEVPDLNRVRAMRLALGDFPLALSGGIFRENAPQFLAAGIDCIFAATAISENFYTLNEFKLRELNQVVEDWEPVAKPA